MVLHHFVYRPQNVQTVKICALQSRQQSQPPLAGSAGKTYQRSEQVAVARIDKAVRVSSEI